jgi:hypothetical protein
MLRIVVSALTVAFSAAALAAQEQAPRPAERTSSTSPAITLTGCVSRSGDGKDILLTQQAGAPGTATSPATSSAAATSPTGDSPSGSVTGDTPTGTTAVETAVPTPPVGEPGTSVNPASPTYSQGAAATGTSGSGTVGRADTAGAATPSVSYRLRAPKSLDLAAHVGHTVEVRGTLERDARAQGTGSASGEPGNDARIHAPVLTVQTLTHRAADCTR